MNGKILQETSDYKVRMKEKREKLCLFLCSSARVDAGGKKREMPSKF